LYYSIFDNVRNCFVYGHKNFTDRHEAEIRRDEHAKRCNVPAHCFTIKPHERKLPENEIEEMEKW